MTPTRADLERLIELPPQPEQPSHTGSDMAESGEIRRNYLSALEAWERVCNAIIAARAALLTSEGPAQRPETPTVGTCATCKHWMGQAGDTLAGCRQNVSAHSDYGANTTPGFGCILHDPMPLPDAPKEPTAA